MGSRLWSDTFDIHFEKAREDVDGAYAAVNCEFARYLRLKYPNLRYLNREDDVGLAGASQGQAVLQSPPHGGEIRGVSGGGFPGRLTTPSARRSLSFGRSGGWPLGIRMSLLRAFLPAATAPGAAGARRKTGTSPPPFTGLTRSSGGRNSPISTPWRPTRISGTGALPRPDGGCRCLSDRTGL